MHPYIGLQATTSTVVGTIVAVGPLADNEGATMGVWLLLPDGSHVTEHLDRVAVAAEAAHAAIARSNT